MLLFSVRVRTPLIPFMKPCAYIHMHVGIIARALTCCTHVVYNEDCEIVKDALSEGANAPHIIDDAVVVRRYQCTCAYMP